MENKQDNKNILEKYENMAEGKANPLEKIVRGLIASSARKMVDVIKENNNDEIIAASKNEYERMQWLRRVISILPGKLDEEIKNYQIDLGVLPNELRKKSEKKVESEPENLAAKVKELEEALVKKEKENKKLKKEKVAAEQQHQTTTDNLNKEIKRLQQGINLVAGDRSTTYAGWKETQLQSELSKVNSEIEQLKKYKELYEGTGKLEAKNKELISENQQLKTKINELEQTAKELGEKLGEQQKKSAEEKSNHQAEILQRDKKIAAYEKELQGDNGLRKRVEELEKEQKSAFAETKKNLQSSYEEKTKNLEKTLEQAKKTIKKLNGRIKLFEQLIKAFSSLGAVKKILSSEKDSFGKVDDLNTVVENVRNGKTGNDVFAGLENSTRENRDNQYTSLQKRTEDYHKKVKEHKRRADIVDPEKSDVVGGSYGKVFSVVPPNARSAGDMKNKIEENKSNQEPESKKIDVKESKSDEFKGGFPKAPVKGAK